MATVTVRRHHTADGTGLRFWTRRDDRPPQVMLVHGLASNARLWDGVAALLAEAGHLSMQPDLRGHGLSDKPPSGYEFPTMTSDLAGLIEAHMDPPVLAVGQSFGGNLVLELAIRFPELVSGIVCLDGGFIDLAAVFGSWEACLDKLTPPSLEQLTVESLEAAAAQFYPGWSPAAIQAQRANLEEMPGGTIRRRLPLEHHLSILRAMYEQRPLELAAVCPCPVLVIPAADGESAADGELAEDGELDDKRRRVERFAQQLTKGRVRWLTGHHDLHAEQPEMVAQTILESINDGFLR